MHCRRQSVDFRRVELPPGMTVLFKGRSDELRSIALVLDQAGIRTVTGPVPGAGWGTTVWLAVASTEVAKAQAAYEAHFDHMAQKSGLATVKSVADFDAEETSCPACMTPFKTKGAVRCPECGLKFSD